MTLFLPKINQGCQGQSRTKRLSSLTGGWKSSYYSPLPVEGEIFFLTFPFIDQALSLKTLDVVFSSAVALSFCPPRQQIILANNVVLEVFRDQRIVFRAKGVEFTGIGGAQEFH